MRRRKNYKAPDTLTVATPDHLASLIAPLLRVYGISVRQFEKALRYAVVHSEASRFSPRKANKAQIAFSTGLNRADIAQLLRLPKPVIQSSVQRLTELWTDDVRFLSNDGKPADLPVFGKTKSFEKLVTLCGKGLPIRAILDELLDRGAVALLPGQKVRLQPPKLNGAALAKAASALESAVHDIMEKDTSATLGRPEIGKSRRTHLKRPLALRQPNNKAIAASKCPTRKARRLEESDAPASR